MLRDIEDFALERYFARWEFTVERQLSASDVEPWSLRELLALADDDARARWERLTLGYTESTGLPALREAIASLYQSVTPDQVLVTAGAEESIFLTLTALLRPGDRAVVVTPAYQSLTSVAESIGATVHRVPLRWENAWRLELDELARAAAGARVVVVNFPHNPTGAHLTVAEQERLVRIVEDAGAVLLSDEVYRGLVGEDGVVLPAAVDRSPRAVSIGVMSKSFALAGIRIGWVATRDADALREVARLKDYTTICSSAPSEILALIALRARDAVLARSQRIVATNVAAASAFMDAHAARIEWQHPAAGSTAFPRLRRGDAETLAARLRERERVLLLPGQVFGAAPEYFRLGLGRADLPLALESLGRCLAG